MKLEELTAISPVDGRYRNKTSNYATYFSEFALIHYRVRVEIEYFIALAEIPLPQLTQITEENKKSLRGIYENFSLEDAQSIKETEKVTNHDVKSVEYFIKEKMTALGLENVLEFVHFGLTSQDVNNTAIPLSLKEAFEQELFPEFDKVFEVLKALAEQWDAHSMLAFTHGQPASPTKLGKEIAVFAYRLQQQIKTAAAIPYSAKFGGATGNFNAHQLAYPEYNWIEFGNKFVNEGLGLDRALFTTQIENYDFLAAWFDLLKRMNNILVDLSRDIWQYISLGYFKQKIKAGEVGSSAMPHKVNPIDFENAEGNLGIANAILEHLAAKLPVSRLQRDLTDSTVLRNIGVPVAHISIALQSLLKGLGKLELNENKLAEDLEANWAVVAEAIQTVLRREGYPKPYEALKALTRKNEKITQQSIHAFIETLEISDELKASLKEVSPFNYTGVQPKL
ncbi:adenylosuccinate lyase [Chondrinema litorale]|uniref:adenylosuccinate lyase n=1 Tax=Chondrinema litorale TaxID=2994555 RepID=UPI002544C40B|nr:adenylosuccinate lyase [Chondrinema litorale]UZR94431.1 adenylosuccinate lyase [Chondrinema litorale]